MPLRAETVHTCRAPFSTAVIPAFISRHIPRQPAVLAFFIVLLLAAPLGWWLCRNTLALLAGFDAAAATYLGWVTVALSSAGSKALRARAARYDAGRTTLLVLAALVFGVVLTALAAELGHGTQRTPLATAIIVVTIIIAWCFGNMIFALEYLHRHHTTAAAAKGLDFPGASEPGFWDFVYFAFTIGMTFQTSDVALCTTALRRLATLHSLLAFGFNVGVVALTVNLLASS